jgi:hypothetical protein
LGFGVTKNGVGMYSAVFEKLEYGIWPFLTKQETTYALWGEIVERHPEDNRKYEELVKSIMRQRRPKSTKGTYLLIHRLKITPDLLRPLNIYAANLKVLISLTDFSKSPIPIIPSQLYILSLLDSLYLNGTPYVVVDLMTAICCSYNLIESI